MQIIYLVKRNNYQSLKAPKHITSFKIFINIINVRNYNINLTLWYIYLSKRTFFKTRKGY